MSSLKIATLTGLCASLVLSASAQAASLSFYLDQSNVLADGSNYLRVDVADGADGAIDFTVQVLGPLTDLAASNFGIQSFAFNVAPGGDAEAMDISGLPSGWKAVNSRRMDGFGRFDIKLRGKGNARLETLTFSITGIDGDSPEDYAVFSTGKSPQGHEFFAARVAGFESGDCDWGGCGSMDDDDGMQPRFALQTSGKDDHKAYWSKFWKRDWRHHMDRHWDGDWLKDCITSGFFGGSTAVPLPGAAWLFLTGAAGILARARRRRA
ncbi:MAG: hypothetical protein KJ054_02695 [Gammaproteobacteria bacterium]|nr:hypothetical protein [Gammaproteobacteria bacterium]